MRRFFVLGDRHCLLHFWKMFKIVAKNSGGRQEQLRRRIISWLCCQKKNSRGAKRGPSERQRMHCEAEEMLQKARQPSMEDIHPYLRDGINDDEYRKSLSLIGWTEQQIIENDKIALEDQSHVATRAERIRNSKNCILALKQNGAQQPLNQRPDFAQAKRECKRLHDKHMARTQQEY